MVKSYSKVDWKVNMIFILALVVGMFIGVVLGILLTYNGITDITNGIFEGSNIQVNFDLNETKLIEGFNKTIIPQLKEVGR